MELTSTITGRSLYRITIAKLLLYLKAADNLPVLVANGEFVANYRTSLGTGDAH
jgi:hypothetical protein